MRNIFDTILIVESIFAPDEAYILNADGSASFGNGNCTIDAYGNLNNVGSISVNGPGSVSVGGTTFNYDGSASFANGAAFINADGSCGFGSDGFSVGAGGSYVATLNNTLDDGSGNIVVLGTASFVNDSISIDAYGDFHVYAAATFANGATFIGPEGGATFANLATYLNNDGSASFANGGLVIDLYGDITTTGGQIFLLNNAISLGANTGTEAYIHSDGSAWFAGGGITLGNTDGVAWINYDGSALFADGELTILSDGTMSGGGGVPYWQIRPNGSASFAFGNIYLGNDGSASFASSHTEIDWQGNITTGGWSGPTIYLNADGSASFATGAFTIDPSGNLMVPNIATSDPNNAGQVWSNAGVLTVSAG